LAEDRCQIIDEILDKTVIPTMSLPILVQIVYNVTHLSLMASDYGQTLTSYPDGKYLNDRYTLFLHEAAARFVLD
jgi:hypothetical protein